VKLTEVWLRREMVLPASQIRGRRVAQRRVTGSGETSTSRNKSCSCSAIFNTYVQWPACKIMRCATKASTRTQPQREDDLEFRKRTLEAQERQQCAERAGELDLINQRERSERSVGVNE
jgi:hypothetical protein